MKRDDAGIIIIAMEFGTLLGLGFFFGLLAIVAGGLLSVVGLVFVVVRWMTLIQNAAHVPKVDSEKNWQRGP